MMADQQAKRVIVVLGPGRSGTSLVMQVLHKLGMTLSEKMISGRHENPEGFFEDADIVEIHRQLFQALSARVSLPLPGGWMETSEISDAKGAIANILQEKVQLQDSVWGFKDPRTCSFLPLWNRILNRQRITPVFLLAVRRPAMVISSEKRYYNIKEELAELRWLQRITDALHHTGADCFIVHYEDWFTRPVEQAQGLLTYTGLDQYFTGNVEDAIKDVVKPNLNRAVYEDYEIQNENVVSLYDVLKECRGDEFDRAKLMAVVKECRKAMDGFKGWYLEAQRFVGKQKQIGGKLDQERARKQELKGKLDEERKRVQELEGSKNKAMEALRGKLDKEREHGGELKVELEGAHKRVRELETDLEGMVLENNRLLKASKDYFEQAEEYRKQVVSLKEQNKGLKRNVAGRRNASDKGELKAPGKMIQKQASDEQVKKMRRELIKLRYRYSFRLGKILTDAILRPGKNTVLMPYYLTILFWDIVTGRGRRKVEQVLVGKKLA